jgi:hypothetical protein
MAEGVAVVTVSASALPTLSKLRSLVYAVLRDDERSFVEPWFVDAMLNEAYIDLVARLRLKPTEITSTTSATGTITVPTDYIELIDLWIGVEAVSWVTDPAYQFFAVPQSNVDGILARMDGQTTIETYPAQVSKAYTLRYAARPVEMLVDQDTPATISRELTPRLVNYARAYAKWQEGMNDEGDRFMALYEQGLPMSPRDQFKLRPAAPDLFVVDKLLG